MTGTSDDEVAAQLALLRAEVRRLEAMVLISVPHGWHGWLARLDTDARLQYRIHMWATRFWVFNAIAVVTLFFLTPGVWLNISVLYLILISLYANLSTDYGAMSAALAINEEHDYRRKKRNASSS
jgi:hypothetical protein